ncbi:hypothetical protein T12_5538 [Trichinella patagoniensis]|uniref:Uncharacterized protein n=1 Tax=Trichinella patagoniensis TaxID=990121 RepID=A0A0V0Z6A3_9BILA|nr:hypothetical protein T12_5538 [Trichinella patagoniensis]
MIARASLSMWAYLRSATASVREWNAIGASLLHGSLWARTHLTPCGEVSQVRISGNCSSYWAKTALESAPLSSRRCNGSAALALFAKKVGTLGVTVWSLVVRPCLVGLPPSFQTDGSLPRQFDIRGTLHCCSQRRIFRGSGGFPRLEDGRTLALRLLAVHALDSATISTSWKYGTTPSELANSESMKRWKIPGAEAMPNWSHFALKAPLCVIIVCNSAEASSTSSR